MGCNFWRAHLEVEASARAVLLECAARFSPRIEEVSRRQRRVRCVLDITGTERLFGPPEKLAERLRSALLACWLSCLDCGKCELSRGAHEGGCNAWNHRDSRRGGSACAGKLPVAALNLAEEHQETFAIWGIRTLGELAALPEVELVTRLGPQARAWRELARGVATHTLSAHRAGFSLQEFCEFETPVEQMESLLFIGARMIDCLVARPHGTGAVAGVA